MGNLLGKIALYLPFPPKFWASLEVLEEKFINVIARSETKVKRRGDLIEIGNIASNTGLPRRSELFTFYGK